MRCALAKPGRTYVRMMGFVDSGANEIRPLLPASRDRDRIIVTTRRAAFIQDADTVEIGVTVDGLMIPIAILSSQRLSVVMVGEDYPDLLARELVVRASSDDMQIYVVDLSRS